MENEPSCSTDREPDACDAADEQQAWQQSVVVQGRTSWGRQSGNERRLLSDMKGDVWNEAEIDQRSRQLADYVNEIWPDPEVLARTLELDVSVPDPDPEPAADGSGRSRGSRERNDRYRRFWSHYAQRYPVDGVKPNYGLSNQWIRRGNDNPTISLMFAHGSVGIFFTKWDRVEGERKLDCGTACNH